jgi:hypothetical protein
MSAEILFRERTHMVAGKASKWARRRKIDLAELVDEPWLLLPSNTILRALPPWRTTISRLRRSRRNDQVFQSVINLIPSSQDFAEASPAHVRHRRGKEVADQQLQLVPLLSADFPQSLRRSRLGQDRLPHDPRGRLAAHQHQRARPLGRR